MPLLRLAALFFLLSNSLCRCEVITDVENKTTSSLPETSTIKASVVTSGTVSVINSTIKPTPGTPPKGTNDSELSKTPLTPALTSVTTAKHEETTTQVLTTKATESDPLIKDAASMLPSSQNRTANQSSINTTEISATTQLPDTLPKSTVSTSASLTTAKNISQPQGTDDGKITTTPSTIPSYSSIILPVVIALIVMTLLVFTLVGLYRMCWKRDPGAPENGNDQPQADKDSVKLLTVKTISHESGEHSAQGKTKN